MSDQKLLWINRPSEKVDYPWKTKPKKCWTLYMNTDPDNPPELPFNPKHLKNALLESAIHDWYIYENQFCYIGTFTNDDNDDGRWMLLEF